MKRLHLCVVAVLLTVVVGLPAAAQDDVTVTYTVAASDLYTVTNNGGDPTITFTDCLTANHTYTLDFTVAVTTNQTIMATLATVGEGSFNFIPQGFTPPTIQTSGTGTDTVNVRGTFRAGPNVFPPNDENRVGIYLLGPNDSVLGDVIMSVRYACVVAPRQVFLPLVTTVPPPTAALRGTLAYVRDGNIYTYSFATTQPRLLITNGRDMQFSPDGTQLAFVRDDGLYLARADGTSIRRITTHTSVQQPRWSDDGTKVLWERASNPATPRQTDEIWTVALPNGTPAKIATGQDPAWAPDSLRVAYVTVSAGATNWNHLRLVNWHGQNGWSVVTSVPANTPPIGIPGNEVPRDQLRHRMVTPVWNAQGTAVYVPAFVVYQALGDFFIWERADATHGGSVFLSELPAVGRAVASPDHRAVIFATYSPSGHSRLLARSLDPHVPDSMYAWAAPHADAAVEQFGLPAWSPQTDAVAMFRCRATCDLVVLAPGYAEPQVVLANVPPGPGMGVAWGRAEE